MSLLNLESPASSGAHDRAFGWAARPARTAAALVAGLFVTGLPVALLHLGAFAQWSLLIHTVVGLVALVPIARYVSRHGRFYRHDPHLRTRAAGLLTAISITLAAATGLWVAARAFFGQTVPPFDRTAHLVFALAAAVFALAHLLPVGLRRPEQPAELPPFLRARRGYLRTAGSTATALAVAALAAALLYRGPSIAGKFPAAYPKPGGSGRPFAPALATTRSRDAVSPRALSGSSACGSPGCHPAIYAEWSVSAHRWSAMDLVFRRVSEEVGRRNGAVSTRFCAGCHEPVSLFAAAAPGTVGLDEGVSCASCHSIRNGPTNAEGYVIQPPARYLFESSSWAPGRAISHFLIRAYPRQHRESFAPPVLKTSEACASCHQQLVEAQADRAGLLRIQNQYDQWRTSRWNRLDPKATVECRDCHMPLLEGADAAAAASWRPVRDPRGRHRSHRFLGANGSMPVLLGLAGGQTQARMTQQWLQGEYPIPEIGDRWDKGPVVSLSLEAPETAVAGQPVEVRAVVASRKVGHAYPTGPLDLTQAWLEIEARDQSGNVVFSSGALDGRERLQPATVVFRSQATTAPPSPGEPRAELAGMRYAPGVPPGASRSEGYGFSCPAVATRPGALRRARVPLSSAGTLWVSARLRYRKLDPALLEPLFPDRTISAPIVDLARASARVAVYGRK